MNKIKNNKHYVDREIDSTLKKTLKVGDIVFVSPNSWWFKFVKYWTRDKWGHVAVITKVGKDIEILEALPKGIEINSLREHLIRHRDIKVYRFEDARKSKVSKFLSNAKSFIGKGYDFKSLLNFIVGKPKYRSKKRLFCSELIYRALVGAKLLKHSEDADMVSPHDLRLLLENVTINPLVILFTKISFALTVKNK